MIALSHDLPAEHADDRNAAADPSRARDQHPQPEASSSGDAAVVRLIRLLGRQAAQEHFRSQGEVT